jgi:hypothetical protein
MEQVFPVVCFCIARQMLTTCMSTRKRAWQRMPFLRSQSAKPLSLLAIPTAGYTGGNVALLLGRGSLVLALQLHLF